MTPEALKEKLETQAERIFGSWRGVGKRGVMRLIYDSIMFGMAEGRAQAAQVCEAYDGDARKDTRHNVSRDILAGIEAAGRQKVGIE